MRLACLGLLLCSCTVVVTAASPGDDSLVELIKRLAKDFFTEQKEYWCQPCVDYVFSPLGDHGIDPPLLALLEQVESSKRLLFHDPFEKCTIVLQNRMNIALDGLVNDAVLRAPFAMNEREAVLKAIDDLRDDIDKYRCRERDRRSPNDGPIFPPSRYGNTAIKGKIRRSRCDADPPGQQTQGGSGPQNSLVFWICCNLELQLSFAENKVLQRLKGNNDPRIYPAVRPAGNDGGNNVGGGRGGGGRSATRPKPQAVIPPKTPAAPFRLDQLLGTATAAIWSSLGPLASQLRTHLSTAEKALKQSGADPRRMHAWTGCMTKCLGRATLTTPEQISATFQTCAVPQGCGTTASWLPSSAAADIRRGVTDVASKFIDSIQTVQRNHGPLAAAALVTVLVITMVVLAPVGI